jgi:hypothetical protein
LGSRSRPAGIRATIVLQSLFVFFLCLAGQYPGSHFSHGLQPQKNYLKIENVCSEHKNVTVKQAFTDLLNNNYQKKKICQNVIE